LKPTLSDIKTKGEGAMKKIWANRFKSKVLFRCKVESSLCFFLILITSQTVNPTATLTLVQDAPEKDNHYFNFLKATYQHKCGKIPQAFQTYNDLLKTKSSPYVHEGVFHLLFETGQYAKIIQLYNSKKNILEDSFKDDIQIQLILAQSYLSLQNDTQAEKIFKQLATKHPDNEQVAYFATLAFLKQNDFAKADDLISRSLSNPMLKNRHFLFYFLKSKLLIQQNRLHEAVAAVEKSIQLFPKFERAWLLKSILFEQLGKINDAINGYKRFLDLVGRDSVVERQLIQLLFLQNRHKEAMSFINSFKTNSPEYLFDLAILEFKAGRENVALAHINKALEISPQFQRARFLKIDILLYQKKYSSVLKCMEGWITDNPDDSSTIHALMLLRKAGITTTSIIRTLKMVEHKKPNFLVLAAIADLYIEMKNYKQALECYQKIISITQDYDIKSKTLFQISYLYSITNQNEQLEKTLQKALTIFPVYPSTYNLLAFHYANKNKNLSQALELIEKALEKAPECYYYLDTKGYILHKLGRNKEAIGFFKHALEYAPHDQTILKHIQQAEKDLLCTLR
jgi:tetratricopeptide (TPR) repeat protein